MIETPEPSPAPPTTTTPRRRPGCFMMSCLSLLILATVGGLLVWRMIDRGSDFARYCMELLSGLPERLQTHKITETFHQEVTKITSTNGDVLEIATMETVETVTKSDTKSLLNETIYLGTTESEIRVPVVYRFNIKLSDPWQLSVQDGHCVVIAPPVRPSLPPAIRTEGMEKRTEAGWLRFNASESLAQLEKNLTPTLEKRAGGHIQIPGVRENCRKSVAQFVRAWLLREQGLDAGLIKDIVVIFPDEPAVKNPVEAAAKMTGLPVVEQALP